MSLLVAPSLAPVHWLGASFQWLQRSLSLQRPYLTLPPPPKHAYEQVSRPFSPFTMTVSLLFTRCLIEPLVRAAPVTPLTFPLILSIGLRVLSLPHTLDPYTCRCYPSADRVP